MFPRLYRWLVDALLAVLICVAAAAFMWGVYAVQPAQAAAAWRGPVIATWYGPGFYGNTTACGQRYTQTIRGVAHRTLPCGTKLTIRRCRTCIKRRVRVIDRGPYSGATFDLSARTAMDLCRCWKPYTMRIYYRRGW